MIYIFADFFMADLINLAIMAGVRHDADYTLSGALDNFLIS